MAHKAYKAKTLSGAQQEVRRLANRIEVTDALLEEYAQDRKVMAMLAADGPAFHNPIAVFEAKKRRDEILRECRFKPDGSPL